MLQKVFFSILFFIFLTTSSIYAVNDAPGLQQIEDIFKHVISVIVGLAFIVLVIILTQAGIKYLTSGGEPKGIQNAHMTVTWAFLGILFLAIGWLVLQLIRAFTGIDVTIFDVQTLCGGAGNPFCN